MIPFNAENIKKCRRGVCPLHQASQCITQKMAQMRPGMPPDPHGFEGL